MDLTSRRIIKGLFQKHFIRPVKRLGQHFLVDEGVFWKIIKVADLKPKDTILEIGPGIGNLTRELVKRVKRVVTVEKDWKMVEILKETLKDFQNVEIVNADILKINLKTFNLKPKAYKIVANLPYYITSPVIRKFLESDSPPKEMVLMVQKEVAQRICPPSLKLRGTGAKPKMNLLAISVWFYAKPEIISYISKKSFWPQPKVDSAIIKIIPRRKSMISTIVENVDQERFRDLFFKIVKAGFSQPRKQLINNLSKELKIPKEKVREWLSRVNSYGRFRIPRGQRPRVALFACNKIQPSQRAETLTIENWLSLVKSFKKFML
ncbi:MAG: ribosomal RNA small subunit methyltransferase A [Candidatus Nealsonbacteria bacterium CG23_combo_of_CG06-09_8_20_14_all_36_12]|uniref:Ribosomal RNA small subunit methyltransferase A n=2 Tax=Candidatus Nealsoniibacteriota TaxID=1817911 RepID=A0A2H0TLC3_9BACT|nr:MAG: ribosomal RNA small subunit methyltransferase A [Candidatus Nealsonbacteria bacterium CG23_combo_of_CG06-09_8_20_14_all_36_12]PIR72953.1 MAG: ribosomal RNA small subunit methyltransferase A [Candidatus Nealsonbacteria bacterium CG10_big_fil_rev_8_21_14_0_10_36_23]